MSFVTMLPKVAAFGPPRITIAASEKYVRRKLKLKKKDPLEFRGIPLVCVGSERFKRNEAAREANKKQIRQLRERMGLPPGDR